MFQEVKRIDYKDFRINVRISWQNRHVGNILPHFCKNNIGYNLYNFDAYI